MPDKLDVEPGTLALMIYALTASRRRQLAHGARECHQTADLIAAFLAPRGEAS